MIKKIFIFSAGFMLSSVVYFAFIYAIGLSLESMGVSLYESEAGQQRNFNIVLSMWLLVALVSGWVLKSKKS